MAEFATSRVFLDAAGSAPVSSRTREAWAAAIEEGWADPSRLHAESRQARALVEGARASIAATLGAKVELTHFTHSPFTALSFALTGVARARRGRDNAVVSAVERVAIMEAADAASVGSVGSVAHIPVGPDGLLDQDELERALEAGGVAVAAVQHANRETGVIQDLESVFATTQAVGVPLIVDATASIGHVDAPVYWDALVAHPADWGGPGALGVVALRPSTRWLPTRSAKNPWAPGGVNVPAMLAAAVALMEREEKRTENSTRLRAVRDQIAAGASALDGVEALDTGDASLLPHTLTLVCDQVDGEALQAELDRRGFAVGSGSACTAGDFPRSHVLDAMGVETTGNVRLGLHPGIGEADAAAFVATLGDTLNTLRV